MIGTIQLAAEFLLGLHGMLYHPDYLILIILTNSLMKSCNTGCCLLSNNLPVDIVNSNSINSFKSLLENHLFDSLCNNMFLIGYHTGCAFTRS